MLIFFVSTYRAALNLNKFLKSNNYQKVYDLVSCEDFPIDFPITDTGISSLGFTCALPTNTPEDCIINKHLLEIIYQFKPDINF